MSDFNSLIRLLIQCVLGSLLIFSASTYATETNLAAEKNFLVFSDVHFTPFGTCHTSPCDLIKRLNQAPPNAWADILKETDNNPPQYGQDTNYWLLQSAMNGIKKVGKEQNIEFSIVLGDLLGHHYQQNYALYSGDTTQQGYQRFVKKTLEFINLEIANAFILMPFTDIYSTVGNNDSYNGDYYSDPYGQFYADAGIIWSMLIKNPIRGAMMRDQFHVAGYYELNRENLKIIVLNSVLFSKNAASSTDAAAMQELDWLQSRITEAAVNQQKVLIALHIGAGVDVFASLNHHPYKTIELWKKPFTEYFQRIINQFPATIMAILPGHYHNDLFQILGNTQKIPVLYTPSISPQHSNNPGIKVYKYIDKPQQITNSITYYYKLGSADVWTQEYDFNQVYQPNCTYPCKILNGMENLTQTNLSDKFIEFYYVSSPFNEIIQSHWLPNYWCAVKTIDKTVYDQCLLNPL